MAYIGMSYMLMAYIGTAYTVIAYMYSHGLCVMLRDLTGLPSSYGPYSYRLYRYGLKQL